MANAQSTTSFFQPSAGEVNRRFKLKKLIIPKPDLLFRNLNRSQLNPRILHLGWPEEMAQLFRPLLELVQVGPNRSLELHGIARSPLARGICLDVLVQVLVRVALVAVRQ